MPNHYQEQTRQINANLNTQKKLDLILNKLTQIDEKIRELEDRIKELEDREWNL